MGATDASMVLDGKLTRAEVEAEFRQKCAQDGYEMGHSYSGGFAEFHSQLVFSDRVFESESAAYDWLMGNAEKWGPALAVRFKAQKTIKKKAATFHGKPDAGSWENPVFITEHRQYNERTGQWDGSNQRVYADQLTEAQKTRLARLLAAKETRKTAYLEAREPFLLTVEKLSKTNEPIDYALLKQQRARYFRAKAAFDTASTATETLIKQFRAKLYVQTVVEDGERWLVGGVVSM